MGVRGGRKAGDGSRGQPANGQKLSPTCLGIIYQCRLLATPDSDLAECQERAGILDQHLLQLTVRKAASQEL